MNTQNVCAGNVISVNPGKKTRGELYALFNLERITRTITNTPKLRAPLRSFLNICFGINPKADFSSSYKLLTVRFIIAIFFGYAAFSEFNTTAPFFNAYLLAFCSFSILTGTLMRLSCAAASFYFASFIIMQTGFANFNPGILIYAITPLMLFILGPGRISIDQLIIKRIVKICKRTDVRKVSAATMSYRAYVDL
ncbi:MAG: hypothetical protein NC204_03325 [Candidatus Amulumruptor caecigallinarius]|nr:hypothetical protein [Candidatus Amulumruptor caecigallinarius]